MPNDQRAQRTATWTVICSVLNPPLVASLLSVSQRTVGDYRDGLTIASEPHQEQAIAIHGILDALGTPTSEGARQFFKAPSQLLDGQTPQQLLAGGDWTAKSPNYAAVIDAAVTARRERRARRQGLTPPLPLLDERPRSSRSKRLLLRQQAGALTPHAASEALGAKAADDAVLASVALTSQRAVLRAPCGLDAQPPTPVRGVSPIPLGTREELALDLNLGSLGLTATGQHG